MQSGEGARATGIDISGEAVRIANECAKRESPDAEFFAMDAERMDFADNRFGVVFGEGILHLLDDFEVMRGYFDRVDFHYFHVATQAAVIDMAGPRRPSV